MSNDQLHNTAGANLSVGDVSLSVAGVAAPALPTSLTLIGSGFGSESALLNYDTFDYAIADGVEIPLSDKYAKNGDTSSNPMLFDSANALTGRSGAMTGTNKCEIFPLGGLSNKSIGKIYATFWMKNSVRLSDSTVFSVVNRSDKIIRIWDDLNGLKTRVSWTQMHCTYSDGVGSSAVNNSTKLYIGQIANQFDRFEVIIDGTSLKLIRNGISMTDGDINNLFDEDPLDGYFVNRLGYDMSQPENHIKPGQSFTTTVAEWYSLGGTARVELSNTPSWGSSGAFERYLQRHDAWSDGSINIPNPYYGNLNTSAGSVYAHVVLENGTVIDLGLVH